MERTIKKQMYHSLNLLHIDEGDQVPVHQITHHFTLKIYLFCFYFTGQHSDYHKIADDTEKINFNGMMKIYENIFTLVRSLEKK